MAADETIASGEATQDEQLQIDVSVQDSGPWKKKIEVVIPEDEVRKALDEKYGEMKLSAAVPGFRKGRAPRRLIEKRFGSDIRDQVKLMLLAQAFEQVEEQQSFEVMDEPDFDVEKVEMPETGDFRFDYEVEVKPEFELPKLEGIKVEKPFFEVTDARLDEAIEELQRQNGTMEDVGDGPAEPRDVLSADVTVTVQGEDGESGPDRHEGVAVRVAPSVVGGIWVEELEKELVGVELGQERQFSTTVVETHPNERYRGKTVDITVSVKGIRRLKPAPLDKELFEQVGVEDEKELRERISENLEQQSDREIRRKMRTQVYEYLDSSVQFDLPQGVVARDSSRVLMRRYYELMQQGVPQDKIQENIEKLKAMAGEQAARELKMGLIMEKVGEQLDIEIADAEVNGFIAMIASQYGRRPERVRDELLNEGRLEDLKSQIRDEKSMDKLLEMADVVDEPEESPAKSEKNGSDSKAKAKGKAKAKADSGKDDKADDKAKKATKASKKKATKDDKD